MLVWWVLTLSTCDMPLPPCRPPNPASQFNGTVGRAALGCFKHTRQPSPTSTVLIASSTLEVIRSSRVAPCWKIRVAIYKHLSREATCKLRLSNMPSEQPSLTSVVSIACSILEVMSSSAAPCRGDRAWHSTCTWSASTKHDSSTWQSAFIYGMCTHPAACLRLCHPLVSLFQRDSSQFSASARRNVLVCIAHRSRRTHFTHQCGLNLGRHVVQRCALRGHTELHPMCTWVAAQTHQEAAGICSTYALANVPSPTHESMHSSTAGNLPCTQPTWAAPSASSSATTCWNRWGGQRGGACKMLPCAWRWLDSGSSLGRKAAHSSTDRQESPPHCHR